MAEKCTFLKILEEVLHKFLPDCGNPVSNNLMEIKIRAGVIYQLILCY